MPGRFSPVQIDFSQHAHLPDQFAAGQEWLTLSGNSLRWLFCELRRDIAPNRESPRHNFEFLASALVPDDLAVDRMLATHMAAKTVTLH